MPLYLVRHGETDWNREKRFQSRSEVPLNARGRAQARAIRDELEGRGVSFTLARSSPLGRARETAGIILAGSGVVAEVEPAFSEVDMGEFEGRLESELRAELGAAYDEWRASQYTEAPPGGESILDGAERVRAALAALKPAAAAGEVLVVAHQAVNMAIKVALSGRGDVAAAATFRQQNHEVDVWDMERGERLTLFRVGAAE